MERFAAISGVAVGMGGLGLMLTGTPLAWLIDVSSWRMGFTVLAGLACVSWLLVHRTLGESVFTMAMFLGVAIVQSLSGQAASWSQALGLDPYAGVLVCVASLLALGALAFRLSPVVRLN